MGHYGKHIIDPETGLCEICDKNAIQEVRQGKGLDQQPAHRNNNSGPNGQRSHRVSYADNQMIPRYNTPASVRAMKQQAYTPPPPASDMWYGGPRRKINSGTGILQQRTPRNYGPQNTRFAPNQMHPMPMDPHFQPSRMYPAEAHRRPYRVAPLEQHPYYQPQPLPVRRVYNKFPPGVYDPMPPVTYFAPPPFKEPQVFHIRLTD
ncbi:unnamed protein product [Adineta steineri]|uniref:Uncharacterized protein n=1 Tax=Adineta steineri TaxID=433720 RepID=A0A813YLJ5_9BILA|nr:unnamed protein product [Adineta steineri]CAF3728034.1 unnamed protein product [Adineta steineri]